MTIEEGLVAQLLGDAAVVALVEARVFPHFVPFDPIDETQPFPLAIAYELGELEFGRTHSGPNSLGTVSITVACLGPTYSATKELAAAVDTCLRASTEVWGSVRVFTVEVTQTDATWTQETKNWTVALTATVGYRR